MKVSVTPSRLDAFVTGVLATVTFWPIWAGAFVVTGFMVAGKVQDVAQSKGALKAAMYFLVADSLFTAAFVGFGVLFAGAMMFLSASRRRGSFSVTEFAFDANGYSLSNEYASARIEWKVVLSVIPVLFGLLIRLPGGSAHFLPRRCFAAEASMQEVAAQLKFWHLASQ